ncbi:cip1-interacting zinc finger protein isoform X2 [Pseudonaja textilis]|uniref:cip1-interacting zinc finger protein isoform X2 n=1 Tax=Pseudonaja textilis TaxID=8673 RepID=UPI000EAA0C33|nr:cip1-interacting zinc finger protein isoform X2 [Pseudonaja textilis]
MFGQQHLLRLQHLLQQQQQQQQQQQTPAPPQATPSRTVTPSQQQMLTLQAPSPASLLNTNPVFQRALLLHQMQGNLRGFNVATAPVLQQFFPQATRHSLLGPPPVSLKPPQLGFPALPFHRQNRPFRKDFPRVAERKREADGTSSSIQGPGEEGATPVGKQSGSPTSESLAEPPQDGEPVAKVPRSEVEISDAEDAPGLPKTEEAQAGGESEFVATDTGEGDVPAEALEESFEEEKTSEVLSNAGALKVTIQQSSESRAISTTPAIKPGPSGPPLPAPPGAALNYFCYVCRTNCSNQQSFQAHLSGEPHQQRLQEVQERSKVCLVPKQLPLGKESAERDGESQQRWCNTCQVNFSGDLIKHRRTQEHKLAKRFLRPFCTVCSRYFKTPRKFVEHMKSLEHKQKNREVRLGEKDLGGPEDSEELITVDAVGCFEEQDEDEDEEEEEAGEGPQLDPVEAVNQQVGQRETSVEDPGGNAEYCPDTVYGLDFLVPVAGFLCRLCHKFYSSDSATRLTHCKSRMHFENLQRYRASRLQATARHTETPSQLTDPQPPSATQTPGPEEAVAGHRRIPPACESPEVIQTCSGYFEAEDICGVLVIDERSEPSSPRSESSAGPGAEESGEGAGLHPLEKQPSLEIQQKLAGDSASTVPGEDKAREGPASQDGAPSTPAEEPTVSGPRRSSRRKAR